MKDDRQKERLKKKGRLGREEMRARERKIVRKWMCREKEGKKRGAAGESWCVHGGCGERNFI
jgi:hypothetical protein